MKGLDGIHMTQFMVGLLTNLISIFEINLQMVNGNVNVIFTLYIYVFCVYLELCHCYIKLKLNINNDYL